ALDEDRSAPRAASGAAASAAARVFPGVELAAAGAGDRSRGSARRARRRAALASDVDAAAIRARAGHDRRQSCTDRAHRVEPISRRGLERAIGAYDGDLGRELRAGGGAVTVSRRSARGLGISLILVLCLVSPRF